MNKNDITSLAKSEQPFAELLQGIENFKTLELKGLAGSAVSTMLAAAAEADGGVHIFIADDRDSAAYLYNDLYAFWGDDSRVLFFPTAYKRSIEYNTPDPSGLVQRTAVLGALRNCACTPLVVCTYPEAVLEKVVSLEKLDTNTLEIKTGDKLSIAFIAEVLAGYGFTKVDFVYEPGQYSVRGGIVDIFSFSDNRPYRVDFFGDEVESIRSFDIGTQLSVEKLARAEIIPDTKTGAMSSGMVSIVEFADTPTVWINDYEFALRRMAEVRTKLINETASRGEQPSTVDAKVITRKRFAEDTADCTVITLRASSAERKPDRRITFDTAPQPSFNKNFDILAAAIRESSAKGYKTYILSENKVQIERLENIFSSIGEKSVLFEPIDITLHEGYTDNNLKINFFTDHQIFNRHHRYTLHKEVSKSESLTVAELNSLKIGDYVVHIDHGVGRFGGLVKTTENGRVSEAIKLTYRDNDVLFVNVHSLHRISKYKDKDSEPPAINKLGSAAWQRLKNAAKKQVKDIARQLITLYAKRKQSKGFAFSHDTYMQHELEASFMYEDTPDQEKATSAVKADMESGVPMDRLVCGDVGFGKTEIAMRAAFKAACDGKQVAVLVPTTMLSLQHYRSFSKRFKEFPVRVELLSRARSAKQTREIIKDLADGKIDILIGTHKILGKDVVFKELGLLIIDEEQKFGVSSKEKLRSLKANVDTLTLTATPIPRTLQFSLMGSRDMSIIATPPPNRQPIATEVHVFNEELIREAIEFEMARGGQIYFIHNRVQNIEQLKAVIGRLVPKARIAVGHGQMKPEELEKIMMDFIYAEYDVLLATTIIESGIDISNVNTIIINNAQNFGLSDLHQLRGRVGRSNRKAFCYLLTPPEDVLTPDARRRLRAIEEFSDLGAGFNIAMQDLDIRGAGNILGAEQSGFIADIGFETYQKILNEAIRELHEEEFEHLGEGQTADHVSDAGSYVTDCQIETEAEAYIPDSYVSNTAEKISLYRELDNTSDEAALRAFEARLIDRFGPVPAPVAELLNILRMRWMCAKLGFEKLVRKNGLMILHFVYNQSSPYYKTPVFAGILKKVTENPAKFLLKQHNNRLQITVRQVRNSEEAIEALRRFEQVSN